MDCPPDRELPMARNHRSGTRRTLLGAFARNLLGAFARTAPGAFARIAIAALAMTTGSLATAQTEPAAAAAGPDVSVTSPPPPTEQEWAGASLSRFIAHHATVHFVNTGTTGNLARWRGGMQSICPVAVGLTPEYDAFVTARLRALAAYVGAPLQSDPKCKMNVQLIFTNTPQQEMDSVIKWATVYFRNRYRGGTKDLIEFKSGHAIEGWYMMTSGGAVVLNTPVDSVGLEVWPVWPEITQHYASMGALGTRVAGGSGSGIGIGIVILVVDTTKMGGYSIETLADYLAMLTLSAAQSPDHCDPLPSILDLMSSSCSTREAPKRATAADLAFLKALYYRNNGLGQSLSRSEIEGNMERQFKLR
ncbi:MAG TPA: hypothetical protein VHZ53_00805 [Steroidobacteraceae bacterium]|jgi:hypothetical protein|nr:hypothetical protein [Steroidobacteraceae bacterium]